MSSYGRGFADNLYDKSMVVVCKFISRVHCDFSCGRDLGFGCGYKGVKDLRVGVRVRVRVRVRVGVGVRVRVRVTVPSKRVKIYNR